MGEVHHRAVLVGRPEPHPLFHECHSGPKPGSHLRGIGPGQNADDLPRVFGGGVGCPRVEAPAVDHLHHSGLGGLIQGAVGHVVAVGGKDTDGAVLRPQSQLLRQCPGHVGNGMGGQDVHPDQISCHMHTSPAGGHNAFQRRSMPLAFFSSIFLINSAMCAPPLPHPAGRMGAPFSTSSRPAEVNSPGLRAARPAPLRGDP